MQCLHLDLRPNGWTDRVRLSGWTFADVMSVCARGVWKRYADGADRECLAAPALPASKDQPVQGLELRLYEDGSLKQVSLVGCTVAQALRFCQLIVQFDVLADNNWLNPDEDDSPSTHRSTDRAVVEAHQMTIEHAETAPEADPRRYPTLREIVDSALARGATLAVEPTRACPHYAVPCEDLDGNPHRLVVVALGGRIALAGPGGATAVLHADAVDALGDPLEDTLVAKVHGGDAGYRFQLTATNLPSGTVQLLEASHRVQARVESRIRDGKDTGLRRLPSKSFAINAAWCLVVALACDLLAWLALLGLDGDLANAEPKTIRYRLLHTAARIIHGQRKRKLRVPQTWPWAHQLQTAFTRIAALPAPS